MDSDLDELLDSGTGKPDFPFDWQFFAGHVDGLWRGNLGTVARPEVGKTPFVPFLHLAT